MLQYKESQSNFLHHLLAVASRPSTSLKGLLRFILERALLFTGSDVGGAICILETSGQKQVVVTSAFLGELTDTSANLIKTWKRISRSSASIVYQSDKAYYIDDYKQNPEYFALLAGGRSSLWVPLLDGKKAMGVIYVESSQPGYYHESHLGQLESFVTKMVPVIERLLLRQQMAKLGTPMDIVGASAPFLELERQIRYVAEYSTAPVLISGERGSGKELTARSIHCWSDRRDKLFVPVLASTLAESLFTDELFGHERYAFTGATRKRPGKFKSAEGGTIFLDDIDDMPLVIQSALLRIIELGELPRLGRDLPLKVNVRVIAATNRNLDDLIAQRRFREDLYDRLSVFEIRVPPLRERREDIPLLASHFLRKYCQEKRRNILDAGLCAACQNSESADCATPEFYQALQSYDWPGNVRELQNLILRLLAFVPYEVLDVKHLSKYFQGRLIKVARPEIEDLTLDSVVRNHIKRVLRMHNYNQSQAAKVLGLPLSTLRSKIKKLGILMKEK